LSATIVHAVTVSRTAKADSARFVKQESQRTMMNMVGRLHSLRREAEG